MTYSNLIDVMSCCCVIILSRLGLRGRLRVFLLLSLSALCSEAWLNGILLGGFVDGFFVQNSGCKQVLEVLLELKLILT